MRKLTAVVGMLSAAAMTLSMPAVSQADPHGDYHHDHRVYHRHRCEGARRHAANGGTVIGAVGGGIAGNLLSHGSGLGTIIGAGVGAVAGHQIAKDNHPC